MRRLAGQLSAEADEARGEAVRVASADPGWESTAAAKYRARLADGAGLVRAAAREMEQLATAVTEHAAAVEHRQHQIASAMSWVRQHLDPHWLEQKAAEGATASVTGVKSTIDPFLTSDPHRVSARDFKLTRTP